LLQYKRVTQQAMPHALQLTTKKFSFLLF